MTSKNSYSNHNGWFSLFLMKDCFKRALWAPALYFIALFFTLPVTIILSLQRLANRKLLFEPGTADWVSEFHRKISFLFGTGNGFLGAVFIITAFVSALTVFFYLHKKKRVDFFHSLPIKRETFFFSHYIAGILFMVIPYVINLALAVAIVFAFGYGNYLSLMSVVLAALQHMLLYILIYSLGVVTTMLTGNLIIHGLLYAFLLVVGPALVGIYFLIIDAFYPTFYVDSLPILSWVSNSSPLAKYIELLLSDYLSAMEICLVIGAILVFIAIALFLYKKRQSDCAGQALAFAKTKPFFQGIITLVISIYMGFAFYDLGRESLPWLFFGIICGGLITSRIIEVIYAFDFHAIKKNLLPTAIFLGVICGLFTIPIYDITGFNDYLPARDQVTTIKLNVYGVYKELETAYFNYPEDAEENSFIKSNKYLLTTDENVSAAFRIAAIAHEPSIQGEDSDPYYDPYYVPYDNEQTQVLICFELTNGKKVYREYYGAPIHMMQPELATIFASEEFKKNYYSLNQITAANITFDSLRFFESETDYRFLMEKLTVSQEEAILDGLKADIAAMTEEQWLTELPIGSLYPIVSRTKQVSESAVKPYYTSRYYNHISTYDLSIPIYPCYTHTLAALEAAGIHPADAQPNTAKVDYIIEHHWAREAEAEKAGLPQAIAIDQEADTKEITYDTSRTITDRDEIAKIMANTYPEEAFDYHPFLQRNEDITYTVHFQVEDANAEIVRTMERTYPLP